MIVSPARPPAAPAPALLRRSLSRASTTVVTESAAQGFRSARRTSCRALLMCIIAHAVACGPAGVTLPSAIPPHDLAEMWNRERVSPPLPPLITHADLTARMLAVQKQAPDLFSIEPIGQSIEGRSIHHLWFGRGAARVLLWSQMHGDEPTATAALLDLFEYVRRHRTEAPVRRILEALTVHTVPMLNPDGAARFQRRNAQGIDINRDALALQTPEGRALKALRDRLQPSIGFNLHNQNWSTSVGREAAPASISLLSVAYDEQRSENEGRRTTKRLASVVRDALEPFAAGRIGRYDDSFEVRAFGDNLTKWGTNVLLIETGPWPGPDPDTALIRLNFIAIVSALDALATGRVAAADSRRYEGLPLNESRLLYRKIVGATVFTGDSAAPFTGEVGLTASRAVVANEAGERSLRLRLRVEDMGDLRVYGTIETIDATGRILTPLFRGAEAAGSIVRLPDWRAAAPDAPRIAIGRPAAMVLLKQEGEGRYHVERVLEEEILVSSPAPRELTRYMSRAPQDLLRAARP